MKPLLIIGAGGVGREATLIVEAINRVHPTWDLLGFIDDFTAVGTEYNGVSVLGPLDILMQYKEPIYVVCAIANYTVKKKIIMKIKEFYPWVKFAKLIHPKVDLNPFMSIGEGCIIYQQVMMTVDVILGDHVIVCASTGIGHDSVIKDYCDILWNCNISGHVTLEEGCFIGSGATIVQGLKIGPQTKVGAGSVVLKSTYGYCTVVGVPAKVVRGKKMKKILYVTTVSRTVNAFLVPHIMMLLDQGYLVDIACCVDQEVNDILLNRGVEVYDLPFTRNPLDLRNLKAFKKLSKIQKENRYETVHVHTPIAALYGRLLKLKYHTLKTVYTVHGFHFHQGGSLSGWLMYYPIEWVMAKFTDQLITINDEDFERGKQLGARATYKVNGVGVTVSDYQLRDYEAKFNRYKYDLAKDDFVILMIAEVNKNKNHHQMIQAVELLKQRGKSVKVLCAGEGSLFAEVVAEVEKRGLSDSIQMLGYRTDIKELIGVSDIGILLSYREGLPRNIMELMACGKPVIGTNIRGIRDLVIDGETGFLVPVGDAVTTADCIEKLMSDAELVSVMGVRALEEVEKYNVESVVGELQKILV
ncbi:NeuD/PglB/VioB family sugar acetyltransferase [Turicibacter sanguinis]|uniref:NeuD/PglB/VioB family sugar acetyltransferase n=1 Tax=Turicibacter sanguinis TaxID=154288 RepID=UPI0018AB313A|nr:NeuD/PglB/VioB family sugar acetyltransferase [Turicibacter sanguinis]MDB8558395.1 NeuD/PglB/VioB family sugar acetyltransferase [Turicibacter sanguinis]MDB8561191.1 NeuD/PglB/VioB family sugar acetyltransferase [Turicibacter sanguinis]